MNAIPAIDKNHEALKRILAMLLAMAGFAGLSFSACGRKCRDEGEVDWRSTGTLPRRLHSLILLTLRPAKSATRRLIVAMARGISITVRHAPALGTPTPNPSPQGGGEQRDPATTAARVSSDRVAGSNAEAAESPSPQGRKIWGGVRGGGTLAGKNTNLLILRPLKPKTQPGYIEIHPSNVARNGGPGIILPPNVLKRIGPDNTVEMYLIPQNTPTAPAPQPRRKPAASTRSAAFPLLDPVRSPRRCERRYVPAHLAPRIWTPGYTTPHARPPAPQPPSPYDQIDAARLGHRLSVLGAALAAMPAQAQRFARWKARRDLGRTRRSSPLRPGRPPGARLAQWNPDIQYPRRVRDVDEVAAHCHSMALFALENPRRDSS